MAAVLSRGRAPAPLVVDQTVDRSGDLREQLLDLVQAIRAWPRDEITETHVTPGFINLVRCYHHRRDDDLQDGLVVRVQGSTRGTFVNRHREFLALQLATRAGCFRGIEAVFNNGLVYAYIPARSPSLQELNETAVIEHVTRALARFHHQGEQGPALRDRAGAPAEFPRACTYFQGVRCWLSRTPETLADPERDIIYQQHRLRPAELEEELGFCEGLWNELDFDMCISHGDFHKNNILYNPNSGEVNFIDYEISEYRPEGFDLAYLLANTPIYDAHERKLFHGEIWHEILPQRRKMWLRFYLQAILFHRYGYAVFLPQEETELFCLQVEILEIIITLATLVNSQRTFVETLPRIKKRYFANKSKLLTLKESYMTLKRKRKQPREPPPPLCQEL